MTRMLMATNERDMIASRMCQWLATRLNLYVLLYNTLSFSLYGKRYRSPNRRDIILRCVVKPDTLFTFSNFYRLVSRKKMKTYAYVYLEIYLDRIEREREREVFIDRSPTIYLWLK